MEAEEGSEDTQRLQLEIVDKKKKRWKKYVVQYCSKPSYSQQFRYSIVVWTFMSFAQSKRAALSFAISM